MTNILRILQTELMKIRRTIIIWVIIIPPILYGVLIQQLVMQGGDRVIPQGSHAWEELQGKYWPAILMLFTPIFISLINSVSHFLDNKNNIWKVVYTMPIPSWITFIVKGIFTLFLVFVFFILLSLVLLPLIWSINWLSPELIFTGSADFFLDEVIPTALKAFVGSLAVWSIHNWISYRFENYIISVVTALLGSIVTAIAIQGWEYIQYVPYALPFLSISTDSVISTRSLSISLLLSSLIFIASVIDQRYFNYNK